MSVLESSSYSCLTSVHLDMFLFQVIYNVNTIFCFAFLFNECFRFSRKINTVFEHTWNNIKVTFDSQLWFDLALHISQFILWMVCCVQFWYVFSIYSAQNSFCYTWHNCIEFFHVHFGYVVSNFAWKESFCSIYHNCRGLCREHFEYVILVVTSQKIFRYTDHNGQEHSHG